MEARQSRQDVRRSEAAEEANGSCGHHRTSRHSCRHCPEEETSQNATGQGRPTGVHRNSRRRHHHQQKQQTQQQEKEETHSVPAADGPAPTTVQAAVRGQADAAPATLSSPAATGSPRQAAAGCSYVPSAEVPATNAGTNRPAADAASQPQSAHSAEPAPTTPAASSHRRSSATAHDQSQRRFDA
uniref:(northern house mosquito) hypothetical protein n=1 Tax=Culex pipiens TaxID=7175 RepID=A0A8D8J5F0_CULPI